MKRERTREGKGGTTGCATPSRSPSGGPGRFSAWQVWFFRLCLGSLFPLLFLVLLEAGLRLGGYGYPTKFFVPSDAAGTFHTNDRFGWRFFPKPLSRDPRPIVISAKPDAETIRIFVLGSSAAMGTPDPSFGFQQILAVMLRACNPGVKFEVVNAAMTAINSHVALEIARDCADLAPDLFIVYMGNNEVVGPYGPGTVFNRWVPDLRLIRAIIRMKTTRVGQLLGGVLSQRPGELRDHWRGMEMFVDNPVEADDPRLTAVYDNFRMNLEDLCAVARKARAPVILSTVAVNRQDCPPLRSLHRSDLSPELLREWDGRYKEGNVLEESGNRLAAIAKYEAAARIDDHFAELPYRLGRCLAAEGKFAEALDQFSRARDEDALRFRADSRINATIRTVAARQVAAGVRLADAEQALGGRDWECGISGANLFYDHVHLTFAGNYQLARVLLDAVHAALPRLSSSRKAVPVPSMQYCAQALTLTPWDEVQMAEHMFNGIISLPVFCGQLDHSNRLAAARQNIESLRRVATTPEALQAALKAYQAAMARAPAGWELHEHLSKLALCCGRSDVAVEHRRIVLALQPWSIQARVRLGEALTQAGKLEEAIGLFEQAVRLRPDSAEFRLNLGSALGQIERPSEAVRQLEKALQLRSDYGEAHNNLGNVLLTLGKADEAAKQYEQALASNQKMPETHHNLGQALVRLGRLNEAIGHYEQGLRLRPDYADAHLGLGNVLQQTGRHAEAIDHYEQVLRLKPNLAKTNPNLMSTLTAARGAVETISRYEQALRVNPDDAEAHSNLGNALRQIGRVPEAIGHYEQALGIKPDNAEVHFNLALALEQTGKFSEAVGHYTEALRLNAEFLSALNNLAWIRATSPDPELRDGAEAVRLAERACQLKSRKDMGHLDTLSAAYAEAGRLSEAVATAQEALALAQSVKQENAAAQIESHLALYRAGKPFRQRPRAMPAAGQ